MTTKSCCGGSMPGKKRKVVIETLPPNPVVSSGVTILYLGSGKRKIMGTGSGSIYFVSDHHRQLKVFRDDAEDILSMPYFIRKP